MNEVAGTRVEFRHRGAPRTGDPPEQHRGARLPQPAGGKGSHSARGPSERLEQQRQLLSGAVLCAEQWWCWGGFPEFINKLCLS